MHSLCVFFVDTPPTDIYTLSLHDALPILALREPAAHGQVLHRGEETVRDPLPPGHPAPRRAARRHHAGAQDHVRAALRSEEHTSELQSQSNLVCRLLLEKKKPSTTPRLQR